MSNLYVQYGCGMSSPQGWKNFDASPTLRLQQLPLIGNLLKQRMHIAFPDNVLQGDIIRGLPGIAENSADGVYCSHVLEHLTYEDFLIAVRNTYRILKPGGIFRCVVPDLEKAAREYVEDLGNHDQEANAKFLQKTRLGKTHRRRGIKGLLQNTYGNSDHLFMWDTLSLSNELYRAGFSYVRPATFNDSEDEMFKLVESEGRFKNAVALEARK